MCARLLSWLFLLGLALIAFSPDPARAQSCRWDGTAPFCGGECGDGETEMNRSSVGSGGVPRLPSTNPFGQDCATGSKAYCCKTPGRTCRWDGTAPFCDGGCRRGETNATPPENVSPGKACLTGSKVYCCRVTTNANSTRQFLSTSPEYSRFAAIWEKTPGPAFEARHGLSSAQYQQEFNRLGAQGFRLIDVSGYAVGDQDTYAAIWEKSPGGELQARHGLTSAQHQDTFNQLTGQGFRLVHVSGYAVGGQDRYASIWQKGPGPEWQARHGLSAAQYQQTFDDLARQGFRLVDVSGYAVGGQDRYAAIWQKAPGPDWQARHGLTSEQYQQQFDALGRQGYRLLRVSGWGIGDTYHYAAIWVKADGPPWIARHGMLADAYQEEFNVLTKDGYRLKTVSGYQAQP